MGRLAGCLGLKTPVPSESLVVPGKRSEGLLRKPRDASLRVDVSWTRYLLHSAPSGVRGPGGLPLGAPTSGYGSYLVDPASSHMLVSKIKPCMSKYKLFIR